jgi:diguanylate cyclase (GGDEF)-like protein
MLGIVVLNINLTRERKFLDEKLRYENLLNSIIEGTNDIIVALNLNFQFIIFNQSFEHEFKSIFGVRPKLNASIIESLAHLPGEQEKVTNLWKRALQGEEFSIIGNFGDSDYIKNVYECNFNYIYDRDGSLIGASTICRNIENRLQSEKTLKTTNEELGRAYSELKHHDADVSLLNEMENALQSCNSIDETTLIISKYCQKLLPFSAGIIYLINPSRNYLEEMATWNSPTVIEKVFSPRQCWGLRQGKTYIYVKNNTSIPCEHMHNKVDSSNFCVPLLAQNEVIGLMQMIVDESLNLSESEILELYNKHETLIKNLSVQLALAIANIQLRDTLKNRSIRDPLTGLYNRTYLNEFIGRDLHRAGRNKETVSIVMMDIDNFKLLNDKYGHDAGDMVLKELGKLLQENIRKSDISCRYGGEEFLLIFYDTNEEGARARVENLQMLISQMDVILRGTILEKITISFGLAIFPEHGATAESLITAADQALYLSKKNGRNQLTIYRKSADY